MKKAEFTLIGKKPFLFHKFNIESITDTKKPKEGGAGNSPSEWKTTLFADGKKLYIPGNYFFSSLVAGGKYVKIGRGTVSKNLAGTLEICNEKYYFLNRALPEKIEDLTNENIGVDSSKDIYLDIRMVSNPNTKGKNVRYRLALKAGWKINCSIAWDDSVISKDQIMRCAEAAGQFSGIGDARAIGYGRFTIDEFKII